MPQSRAAQEGITHLEQERQGLEALLLLRIRQTQLGRKVHQGLCGQGERRSGGRGGGDERSSEQSLTLQRLEIRGGVADLRGRQTDMAACEKDCALGALAEAIDAPPRRNRRARP
jgi:hypothetical protein